MGGVERAAAGVGRAQRGVGDPGRVELARRGPSGGATARRHAASPTIRCAGELAGHEHRRHADAGCGAAPGEHDVLDAARQVAGRNGPVCAKVCAAENGVPAAMPCAGPSRRG